MAGGPPVVGKEPPISAPNTAKWIGVGLLGLPLYGALTSLVVIVLGFVGNVLLGVAVWRSGTLPRWAGALWAAGAVFMYPLGIVYAAVILGAQSTPRTVLVGALLLVVSGAWMALSTLRQPSTRMAGAGAQPRVR